MPRRSEIVIWHLAAIWAAAVLLGGVVALYVSKSIGGSWYFQAAVHFGVMNAVSLPTGLILARLWPIYLNRRKERMARRIASPE
jgi:hypothetical protein